MALLYLYFLRVNLMYRGLSKGSRKGFVLYIVIAIALGLFILIAGLNQFKSGAVLQLSKTVTQEKMIVVAQAAVNEMLAAVKGGINDSSTTIGGAVKTFWKSPSKGAPDLIYSCKFSGHSLPASADMAYEYLDNKGNVNGELYIYATDSIKSSGVISHIGFVKLVGKVTCEGVKDAVTITEQHDLKITDLSFPFLDKYAFFVKSFCPTINNLNKNFVVEGIKGAGKYSFVYLGNRNYPKCQEYPDGSLGSKNPPVLLDLDFNKDKTLLGAFFKEDACFEMKDAENVNKSKGNLFYSKKIKFSDFEGVMDKKTDFHKTKELRSIYAGLVRSANANWNGNTLSSVYQVILDFNAAGGQPQESETFLGLLQQVFEIWDYFYGYSDYQHVCPASDEAFGAIHPFSGLIEYFKKVKETNKAKFVGGAMPQFFGEDRKRPVYIDGPVYVRFFKVGLIDECMLNFNISGMNSEIPFPCIACNYEDPQDTFAGKDVSSVKKIDGMTKQLMSHPIDKLSINNFYFGAGENIENKPNVVSGGIKGYDVFHYLDPQLRTVSSFYDTGEDFKKERIKNIDGQDVLDLDGISLIYGKDKAAIDLSSVSRYRGKGMIVVFCGNCILGDLLPLNDDDNNTYLKLWLMGGRFFVKEDLSSATIKASLISMIKQSDNSNCSSSQEGAFVTKGVTTHVIGNVLIDSLLDMADKKNFKITHDPKVYGCDYPVRVSIGAPKSLYMIDYRGKD